ncbi:MAG: ATP-binding cassette domain-containing protein [Deltaproteobacteria bacterium]|nr:ATP-binding cassette domain-containing protein [Deltaproteobacteria bacterium]
MYRSLRRLFPDLRAEWPALSLAIFGMVLLSAASAGYVALTGPLLKNLFAGGPAVLELGPLGSFELGLQSASAWVLPAIIVALALVKGIGHTLQFALSGRVSLKVVKRLRGRAFERLLLLSPRFYQAKNTADLVQRLTGDTEKVENAMFYGMMPLLRDSMAIAGMFITCVVIDPYLSMFICLVVPVVALPIARFSKWLKRVARVSQDEMSGLGFAAFEAVSGIRTVQAFAAEAQEAKRFEASADRHLGAMLRSYTIRAVRSPVMELLGALGISALVYYLNKEARTGTIDAQHIATFATAVLLMYDPVKKLGNVSDMLANGAAALDRIEELAGAEVLIPHRAGDAPVREIKGEVRLSRVSFSYESAAVLSEVDLHVPAGSVCALVGKSGAGKSTLMQLLLRFYDPVSGSIALDGIDVKAWPLSQLRGAMAWVSQDVFLFNASVRENLLIGARAGSSDDAAVWRALEAAHAKDFVTALPQGLDTVLGERGTTLSGGQRQRIAIARAFLRNAPVLLLDEATSALDAQSEAAVQAALDSLMRGRTTIVIAHRLSTVKHADMIAVMHDGRVVETGRHQDLVAKKGAYETLVALQLENRPAAPDARTEA